MGDGRILMGVIGRPHGVRGLLHVHSYAENDLAGYAPLLDEQGRAWSLVWRGEGIAELRDGAGAPVPDRTAAERLVNQKLFVERGRLPEPEPDDYYWSDLVGMEAVDPAGAVLGRVVQVHDYGGGPSLEVENGWLVPFTKACVPALDVAARRVTVVRPPEVLLPVPADGEADAAPASEGARP